MSEEWISLFDCETLNGWGATGSMDGWTVDDGAILCTVQGGQYLYTEDQFDNFVLEIDYKIEPDCNSGIFLRWGDLNDPVQTGIEIQVLDTYAKEPPNCHDCGAIYDLVAPTKQTMKPAGEWNNHVITCDDSILSVELNGESIVEMDVDQWTERFPSQRTHRPAGPRRKGVVPKRAGEKVVRGGGRFRVSGVWCQRKRSKLQSSKF